ncbi:hypothetical protein AB0M80_21000 [Amycolatopsis sp. NPDC051045]|uniref:hypothetical protein n=1 Tax=Amycolatopsis sp. NPDC051045 TaxID=3156922 RepID=UPI00343BDDE3
MGLQASAGNAAVSGLVALQRQGCPAPPVAPPGVTPATDPKFRSLKQDVGAQARSAKAHPPAGAEVKKAQDAAVAPADDKDAQAKAAQADKMAAAKPAGFDKAAFIAAVNAAIAKQAPKNLDEADKFAGSGKADQVKTEVLGKVTSGKDASAKDVTDRTKEPPDPSRAVEKPVTPLPEAPAPPALAPPDARKATPDKAPPEQTDLRADQCETQGAMAAAGVTDQQLAGSNEPEFTGALAAKQEGEQHTASAPAAVRESEAGQLAAVTGAAQASGQAAMAGMTGARSSSGRKGQAAKSATKTKDEQDRARITGEIKAIFDETKTKVEGVLGALDDQVAKKFEAGEAAAKAAFTADHQARMKRYKDERYDGITGAARWAYDLFADLPAEANNLFLEAKKVYEAKMQGVIGDIADFVGQKLGEAKQLITDGRARVKQKVDSQSPALRKIAGEAAKEFGSQFDDLEKSVDEKQDALVEDLAQKYSEARNAVDEEIKALQAENKGLWSKAKEAVGGAIETILKLKDMLLGVLSRAANAVGLIIAKPIEFLGNLVNAVKTGVMNFGANIVEHLKNGLKGWLLGNLASAGIEIPESLDAKGILKMVMSLLGLTWASVRARILRFIPEPVLAKLEQTLDVVKVLITEGVPGLWRWVVSKLGDLKEMVLGRIKEFVIEKIVKAGITWIISMLNPAAAFIKACKAIYDIVMFFVDKAAQIKEFVDSVLDSVESIARGGAGAVAGLIERTLAKALPMVLGFLASLLGLGGISEKIKSVLEKVQAPVGKVIDSVVGTIVKAGKKIWSKLKGGKKDKAKDVDPSDKAGVARAAAQDAHSRLTAGNVAPSAAKGVLGSVLNVWRPKGLQELKLVPDGDHQFKVQSKVNPTDEQGPVVFRPPPISEVYPGGPTDDRMLTADQAAAKPPPEADYGQTVARGSFLYGGRGHVVGPATSGAERGTQKAAGVKTGAHAEEIVVAMFKQIWVDALKRPRGLEIKMEIDVNRSSCPNCAAYIAGFIKELRDAECKVEAKIFFSRMYKSTKPQRIPATTALTHADVIGKFLSAGKLVKTKDGGRHWGSSVLTSDPRRRANGWHEMRGGKVDGDLQNAKAAIGILRMAGVKVSALGLDRMDPKSVEEMRPSEKADAGKSAREVTEAVEQVDKVLGLAKTG